jgi:AraC-like DNA-binding protein
MPSPTAIKPLRASTRGEPDAAAAVRRLSERAGVLPLQPIAGLRCEAEIVKWPFEELGLLSARLAGLRHGTAGAAARSANSGDALFLGITLTGTSLLRQGGSEATLHAGDGALLCPDEGFAITHPAPVNMVGLRLSRRRLAALLPSHDDTELKVVRSDSPALALLLRYGLLAAQDGMHWSIELQRLAVRQLYELAALTVAAQRDADVDRFAPGVRAARLRVLMADIESRLSDPDLGAASLARQHGVSVRYVHKLFESQGLSCAAFILSQRLARVHRVLSDPHCATQTIATIAFNAGFNDLSHFGRVFRRRYGQTPSDVRRERRVIR